MSNAMIRFRAIVCRVEVWICTTDFSQRLYCACLYAHLSRTSGQSLRCDPASGGFIVKSSNATQKLERTASLSATAACTVQDTDGIEGDSAGDHIAYTIELSNTGTTTLATISVSSATLETQVERYGSQFHFCVSQCFAERGINRPFVGVRHTTRRTFALAPTPCETVADPSPPLSFRDSGNGDAVLHCDPSLESLELGPNGVASCEAVYEVRWRRSRSVSHTRRHIFASEPFVQMRDLAGQSRARYFTKSCSPNPTRCMTGSAANTLHFDLHECSFDCFCQANVLRCTSSTTTCARPFSWR